MLVVVTENRGHPSKLTMLRQKISVSGWNSKLQNLFKTTFQFSKFNKPFFEVQKEIKRLHLASLLYKHSVLLLFKRTETSKLLNKTIINTLWSITKEPHRKLKLSCCSFASLKICFSIIYHKSVVNFKIAHNTCSFLSPSVQIIMIVTVSPVANSVSGSTFGHANINFKNISLKRVILCSYSTSKGITLQ